MSSINLKDAREDARAVLRQRVREKTERMIEEQAELRQRRRVDSESSSETIPPEELFTADASASDYLNVVCLVGVVVLSFYFFLW